MGVYFIYRKGGVNYLKNKITQEGVVVSSSIYGEMWEDKIAGFGLYEVDSGSTIFIGDSHIAGFDWGSAYPNSKIVNWGIGGDIITGVTARIDSILQYNPKKIVLMVGVNNIGRGNTLAAMKRSYIALFDKINTLSPNTKVYVHSILPIEMAITTRIGDWASQNKEIKEVNNIIRELCKKYSFTFIDLYPVFIDPKERLRKEFSVDGVHINSKGYGLWLENIETFIR